MKLYAIAIMAFSPDSGHVEQTVMVTKDARSEDEAVGIGIRASIKRWPGKDGWGNNGAIALRIPDEFIDGAYDQQEWDEDGKPATDTGTVIQREEPAANE